MKSKIRLTLYCVVFIIILGIIGSGILKGIHYKKNYYLCDIKSNIMKKYDGIEDLHLRDYGPYCRVVIDTTKRLSFLEIEEIFKYLLISINNERQSQRFTDRHRRLTSSDLASMKIEFRIHKSQQNRYVFEATSKDNFTIWTVEKSNNTSDTIEYNINDYTDGYAK